MARGVSRHPRTPTVGSVGRAISWEARFCRVSYSLKDLRALSDDELVAKHDSLAINTFVGIAYYVDELNRRALERASRANEEATTAAVRLARQSFCLAAANMFLGLSALVVSVIALLR